MNEKPLFDIEVLEEAQEFIESVSPEARKKIYYNMGKSMYHIDKEIFKKLENTDIWEFRTLYNKMAYRLFAFWDSDDKKNGCRYTWHNKEDTKDSAERNKKSRRNKGSVF